jgi:hypothetical protein
MRTRRPATQRALPVTRTDALGLCDFRRCRRQLYVVSARFALTFAPRISCISSVVQPPAVSLTLRADESSRRAVQQGRSRCAGRCVCARAPLLYARTARGAEEEREWEGDKLPRQQLRQSYPRPSARIAARHSRCPTPGGAGAASQLQQQLCARLTKSVRGISPPRSSTHRRLRAPVSALQAAARLQQARPRQLRAPRAPRVVALPAAPQPQTVP